MSEVEKSIAVIKDILLPLDAGFRYDLYITDKRIAIVCMGRLDREYDSSTYTPLYGIAPTTSTYTNQKRIDKVIAEEEIGKLTLDEKLKLQKKLILYLSRNRICKTCRREQTEIRNPQQRVCIQVFAKRRTIQAIKRPIANDRFAERQTFHFGQLEECSARSKQPTMQTLWFRK